MVHIYKASAGSGKTFVLTREYLSLLFKNSAHYRSTLAVTFTNKASAEMKHRIVSSLYDLSQHNNSPYTDFLMQENDMSQQEIQAHARVVLYEILHNYSFFFIETIDSFFQRILRNFTKEFNLNSQFNLELQQHEVLEKAVLDLFLNLSENKEAYSIVHDFSLNRIEEGKARNVIKEIISYSSILFSEEYMMHASEIEKVDLKAFFSSVSVIISRFLQKINVLVSALEKELQEHNLDVIDFASKNSSFIAKLLKLKNGDISEKSLLSPTQFSNVDTVEKWYAKTSTRKTDIEHFAQSGAFDIVQQLVSLLYSEEMTQYMTAQEIISQKYTIQLLHAVQQSLDRYAKEENIFLISNTNSLLGTLINDTDAPFVYEKTGTYIHNIMIDEFQDTSRLQWKNFRPLIEHVESENGFSLVVGDAKQSIYRFRNGDWKLLQYDIVRDCTQCEEHYLQQNWRSRERIIAFNNAFFSQIPKVASDLFNAFLESADGSGEFLEIIQSLYADVEQKTTPNTQKGGYVRIESIDTGQKLSKEEYRDEVKERTIQFIIELHKSGYLAEDIAILTRGKKEIKEVVQFLNEAKEEYPEHAEKFTIVSSEALKIETSSAVQFLIAVFQYMDTPECTVTQTVLLRYYSLFVLEQDDLLPLSDFSHIFGQLLSALRGMSLLEISDSVIKEFNLGTSKDDVPFIHAFQEQVYSFMQSHPNSVGMFMEWWKEKASKLYVSQPETNGAMQIMTIHKSKGLQFKVVVMPYVIWNFYVPQLSKIIAHTQKTDFENLPIVPVKYSRKLMHTQFKDQFIEETMQLFFDNINNLYVACTRAEEVLCMMYSPQINSSQKISMVNLMQNMEQKFLNGFGVDFTQTDTNVYEYGTLAALPETKKDVNSAHILRDYTVFNKRPVLLPNPEAKQFFNQQSNHTSRSYGLTMHKILERIITVDDVARAVQSCVLEGLMEVHETAEMNDFIRNKIQGSEVKSWFDGSYTVLSEQSILLPTAVEKRPDRIMITDNHAVIVDYKFTDQTATTHTEQVAEYMNIISSMGYGVEGYVWYVQQNVLENVSL
ncbi:MAG: UvrD-helicase domain-containing protein [Bacteroidales bacterium]|jgi:ATP-dependent helicase/nuclease subunit A|nr:UvrD-helicase domain-containing protein [Bacteroidales bacterium]